MEGGEFPRTSHPRRRRWVGPWAASQKQPELKFSSCSQLSDATVRKKLEVGVHLHPDCVITQAIDTSIPKSNVVSDSSGYSFSRVLGGIVCLLCIDEIAGGQFQCGTDLYSRQRRCDFVFGYCVHDPEGQRQNF